MNGSGFDWLNVASTKSGSSSPAPPVSFGFKGDNPTNKEEYNNNNAYKYTNILADQLPRTSPSYLSNQHNGVANDIDDSSIPLSLTAQELTLQESKTYMRWYSDILARTNSRTVTMNDVFIFLHNFKISASIKDKLGKIFNKILHSINIGEFFALLRLISHALDGLEPQRRLIKVQTSVPTPPSILSKKRQSDDDDNEPNYSDNDYDAVQQGQQQQQQTDDSKPLDLDSFTQFMLTGERPDEISHKKKKSKKSKSVKFSDQIVTDIHDSVQLNSPIPSPQPQQLDYSLPMDQLLNRINHNQPQNLNPPQNDEDEQQILKDMESEINHFQNLHSVDTASIGGVPASIHFHDGHSQDNLLKPNMTGPAQMARYFSPSPQPDSSQQLQLLKPNMTGPAQMSHMYNQGYIHNENNDSEVPPPNPTVNDPSDMTKLFAPPSSESQQNPKISLQSFTDQMTGNTLNNTLQNSRVTSDGSPMRPIDNNRSLPPPPIPNNRRVRSISSPTPRNLTGEISQQGIDNNYTTNHLNPNTISSPPPVPPRSPLSNNATTTNGKRPVPPPPPPSRKRNTSQPPNLSTSPPPLPPKVVLSAQTDGQNSDMYANNPNASDSTSNILDDLKALQEEVDKIRNMTGGF